MILIHLFALIFIIGMLYGLYRMNALSKTSGKNILLLLFLSAFLLRCICAWFYVGFTNDINCFYNWANHAYENGISGFYSSGVFSDYPPGYIYLLYVIGAIFSIFKIPYLSGACLLLLKLPAILCDMAAGILLYKTCKKICTNNQAVLFTAFYLFNPAVFINSSLWGQVDSVFTLTVILMCLFLTNKKMVPAYIAFGIGILLKPQTLVFAPVLLLGILDHVILNHFSWRNFFHNLFAGLCVIFCMILVCMPFGINLVIAQYTSTLASYPYVAVNAFNFWGFFGLNWIPQDQKLLFFSYEHWGTIIIVLIVLFSVVLFIKTKKSANRYFITAAFLIISMFLFSVRMHERYLFPAIILLLFAYIKRPSKSILVSYIGFSVLLFYNTAYILFFYDTQNYNRKAPLFIVVSACMVICGIFFYRTLYLNNVKQTAAGDSFGEFYLLPSKLFTNIDKNSFEPKFMPRPSEQTLPFIKADILIILVITVIYSAFALFDLGDTKAPQSDYLMKQGESVTLYMEKEKPAARLNWYLGQYHAREFELKVQTADNSSWHYMNENQTFTMTSVFKWDYIELPKDTMSIQLTCLSDQASIMELALTDDTGTGLMPINAPDYHELMDESDLLPESISFRNGTYFDEVYHARTAYEFLNGLTTYETTHPPLGKIIISIGISLFGMTPFGWRIMGTLLGILMLPLIYMMGRGISKDRMLAGFACLLFAVDFMHFTQSRIATIDVYITFFIILMYYLMYRYCKLSFYDTPLKKTFLPLGACGIAMGLGIASKWTGVYAGAGLAILFFCALYRRFREYQFARTNPEGDSNGISHEKIITSFIPNVRNTILFCMVFFVAIPAVIYLLSYLPFRGYQNGLFSKMWENQKLMLSYHSSLTAEHIYSSRWYEWPTMIRPMFYYSGYISDTLRQGISAFGNPLVWWAGIPAFFYMIYLGIKKRDRTAIVLCISYLSQYLPWCLVSRTIFIYHYFTSVPFVVLMIMYSAVQLKQHMKPKRFYMALGLYAAAATGLFLLFYPVLSGQTVSTSYVANFLRWMDSWVLVYG